MEDLNKEARKKVLTQGTIIKLVKELNFGVVETENNNFLFFHISNFVEDDLSIDDLSEGDVIMCESQIQESDGRASAINCERLEIKGYLKDYFIKNALVDPSNENRFEQFCESSREYARFLKDTSLDMEDINAVADLIENAASVMKIKLLRPKIAKISAKYSEDKTAKELFEIFDELIKNINPTPGESQEMENFKIFSDVLFSYMKTH